MVMKTLLSLAYKLCELHKLYGVKHEQGAQLIHTLHGTHSWWVTGLSSIFYRKMAKS